MGIQRNSRQRDAVLAAVRASRDHPDAETVHARVASACPGIGKATVYRDLAQLCDAGLLRRVAAPGAAVHFDAVLEPHAHFHCRRCQRVCDVATRPPDLRRLARAAGRDCGAAIEDAELLFTGICAACQAAAPEAGAQPIPEPMTNALTPAED